jgi:hypothetical protein
MDDSARHLIGAEATSPVDPEERKMKQAIRHATRVLTLSAELYRELAESALTLLPSRR